MHLLQELQRCLLRLQARCLQAHLQEPSTAQSNYVATAKLKQERERNTHTMQMCAPFNRIWSSFVTRLPSGVISLQHEREHINAGSKPRDSVTTHYSVTSSSTMSVVI